MSCEELLHKPATPELGLCDECVHAPGLTEEMAQVTGRQVDSVLLMAALAAGYDIESWQHCATREHQYSYLGGHR